MKNMFKVSLVAAALAGVCSTAHAARVDVFGGTLDLNGAATGYEVLTAANEFLEVNTNVSVSSTTAAGTHFRIVLEDQYSLDDRIFITFSGTSINVDSLPISRIGYIIPTATTTPALSAENPVRGVITIGRIGSSVVAGNTVVEYRVTNVSEGANTQGAQIFFGATPVVPVTPGDAITTINSTPFTVNAAALRAAGGMDISYRAAYKNGGADFDTGGTRDTNVAFIRTGNQLDGNYVGNLTARINTFDQAIANGVGTRQTFVANSGQGRGNTANNTVTYGVNAAADTTVKPAAAVVSTTNVGNRFRFQFSQVANATGWNYALTNANIATAFTVGGNYSHFVRTTNTGASEAFNGAATANGAATVANTTFAVAAGNQWGAACFNAAGADDDNKVNATFPATGVATPTALRFNCGVGTDFDFGLSLVGLDFAAKTFVERQNFDLTAVMTYTGTAGSATKTLTRNIGTWTNDGTTVFVPYMPYGAGISQLLFVTNTGPSVRQMAVDVYSQNHDRTATTRFQDAQVLNMNIDVRPGVTRLADIVREAMIARGVWNGSSSEIFALEFIVSGQDSEIEIYSGYNVNQDRNLVINNSNGRARADIATDSAPGATRTIP